MGGEHFGPNPAGFPGSVPAVILGDLSRALMAAFAVRLCSKHRGISEAVERCLNARAETKEKAAAAEAARQMGVRGEGE